MTAAAALFRCRHRPLPALAAVGLVLLSLSVAALSQTTAGVIVGVARQAQLVRAEDLARGTSREAPVDRSSGRYRLAGLAPGRYRVTASAPGFHSISADAVVSVDSRVEIDFDMIPATAAYSVEVRGTALKTIDPESPALGYTLDRERIEKLPLNRRDFLQLAFLVPGIAPPVQDSELSSGGSFAMHAGGAREEFNNFTLDGADNNDPYINRFVLQPSLESIGEFKILAGAYSAEYGRSGGAQVNVVTRAGSNDFHGAAYEYLRNRVFDSRNYFDPSTRLGYTRNQFGGALGGPVLRGRAFFFANYEALHERRVFSRLAVTPTAAERQGDLSARAQPVLDPFTRQPFPGNRIPAARVHPLAPRVLDLYSRPVPPQLRDGSHNLVTRYDHNLSAREALTLRYGWGSQNLVEPFAQETTDVPGFGNYSDNNGHNLAAQRQRVWSAATIETTRLAWQRSFRNSRPLNHQTNVGALWGVNWLDVPARSQGYPTIKVTGYSQVGDADNLPLERATGTLQAHETVSLQRGAHALRLGGEFRRIATDGFLDYFGRGSLTFSGALSGSSIGDLLLGLPSFGLQSRFDNRQSLRTSAYNAFVQDDWRLAPNLNLSLGLRYEFNTPPTDPADRMHIYNPADAKLVQVGTAGFTRSGLRPDRNNLAPRLGLAWKPREGWVVRSGYGLYYDASMLVVNSSLYFNPPLFTIRAFFPTATSLITLANPFPSGGGIVPPASPNTISPDIVSGSLHQWNFTVERQLSPATTLTASYAGSKGTHLVRSRDLNQARPAPGNLATRRPNPAYGGIFYSESTGNSNYHALLANLDRRLARGLSVMASYTWAKSIDDTSAFLGTRPDKNFPQDSLNYRAERALSSFDLRHRFVTAGTWALRGGFELRGIFTAQAGQPLTPLLRLDNSNSGNSGNIFGNDRPDLLGNPRLSTRTPERWFNTAAFAVPRPFAFGTAGRNIVTGPGYVNLDAGLSRRFRLTERFHLTLDAQAFNLSNTAHFDMPERYADEPALFGRILSAKAPRQIQFGLRLGF